MDVHALRALDGAHPLKICRFRVTREQVLFGHAAVTGRTIVLAIEETDAAPGNTGRRIFCFGAVIFVTGNSPLCLAVFAPTPEEKKWVAGVAKEAGMELPIRFYHDPHGEDAGARAPSFLPPHPDLAAKVCA